MKITYSLAGPIVFGPGLMLFFIKFALHHINKQKIVCLFKFALKSLTTNYNRPKIDQLDYLKEDIL